jgi:hypothetical protein
MSPIVYHGYTRLGTGLGDRLREGTDSASVILLLFVRFRPHARMTMLLPSFGMRVSADGNIFYREDQHSTQAQHVSCERT